MSLLRNLSSYLSLEGAKNKRKKLTNIRKSLEKFSLISRILRLFASFVISFRVWRILINIFNFARNIDNNLNIQVYYHKI